MQNISGLSDLKTSHGCNLVLKKLSSFMNHRGQQLGEKIYILSLKGQGHFLYWSISLNSLWRSKYIRSELKIFFCFCFLKKTLFKAVLGLQQNWEEGTEIFRIPTAPTINSFHHYQHPSPTVHLLQLMKLHWYISSPPEFCIVYIRAHSWSSTFYGFGQMYDIYPLLELSYRVLSLP